MGGRLFVRVHGLCKSETRLKGSKQFDYYFIIFIFMYCSFFIGSGSFAIVECGVYHSTPIVLKNLHDGTSSDI